MKLIIDNQNKKHFDLPQPIVRREIKEPLDIKTPLVEKTMDVEMSKIIVSIKVNEQLKTPLEKL